MWIAFADKREYRILTVPLVGLLGEAPRVWWSAVRCCHDTEVRLGRVLQRIPRYPMSLIRSSLYGPSCLAQGGGCGDGLAPRRGAKEGRMIALRLVALACVLGLAAVLLIGLAPDEQGPALQGPAAPPVQEVINGPEGRSFNEFVDASYEALLRRHPESVTHLGLSAALGVRNDRLNDYSEAYLRETQALELALLGALQTYDRSALAPDQQVTYDVYAWYLDDLVRSHAFLEYEYLISDYFVNSLHYALEDLMTEVHPLQTPEDAEDYVSRLRQVGRQFDQIIAELDRRAAAGIIVPRSMIDGALPGIRGMASSPAASTAYFAAFRAKLRTAQEIPAELAIELLEAAEEAVDEVVQPAYRRLARALEDLRDEAPQSLGYGQYPGGDAYYAYVLRHHTQCDLSPEEIHQIGLREVDRVAEEILALGSLLGLREDATVPDVYAAAAAQGGMLSGAAVVREYERLIDNAEVDLAGIMPLPSTPIVVRSDPIGGYYRPPALDGSRPGAFYASTQGAHPRYLMPSLAYHETIPGHHLQIALSGELGLPLFRVCTTFTGFAEGWALYAERLAHDLGWYDEDPCADLGRLQYEMLRAVRLVVDTGLHSRGWSYESALVYFMEHVGWSRGHSAFQINRYAAMPGQACAYMLGMLRILALRDAAEQQLGERFDAVEFHEVTLGSGSVPLSVLERLVDQYIQGRLSD